MISFVKVLFIVSLLQICYILDAGCATGPEHDKLVVCYVGTWSVYRPGRGSFALEHLDPNVCTHIVYAFVGLNASANSIRSLDPWQDLTEDYGKGGFQRVVGLKDKYPHLKVTVAIGGWNEGSTNYSQLAANPIRRTRFAENALEFVRKYRFDGLDLDWEFPAKRGGLPEDKENFVSLVKDLKAAFKPHNLLLTAAFGAGKDTIEVAYDVKELTKHLDYIHLMCYDYHGAWDQKTGANAPLRSADVLNIETSVNYMIELGINREKLILGLPLYGRTFHLLDTFTSIGRAPYLGTLAKNVGFQGPFSRENGFMGYNEICMELQNATSAYKTYWDDETSTPFAVSGENVITYDDDRSLGEKIKFAIEKGLGGAMVWSIDTDDFQGDCSTNTKEGFKNYPLMRAINKAIVKALQDVKDRENEIVHGDHEKTNQKGNGNVLRAEFYCMALLVSCASILCFSL